MSATTDTTQTVGEDTPEQRHRQNIRSQVEALRALCDFAEEHADVFPDHVLTHDFGVYGIPTVEALTQTARALGGRWSKHTIGSTFSLERDFGGSDKYSRVKLSLNTSRENVCERIQVGTEVKRVPDPQLVDEIPLVEIEEPVYEWRCPDSLLDHVKPEDFTGPAPENPEPSPW